jgi:tetratricopeptide (TPR) repeat protein
LPPWQVLLAAGTLAAVTAASIGWRRRRYVLVAWLWYVGMLVPVIGLVQFGAGAEADRFTYLPQIGLAIGLAWAAADAGRREKATGRPGDQERRASRLAAESPRRPVSWSPCLLGAVASTCVLAALIVAAWRQTSYWCESKTLWTHALACNLQNMVAHNNLGYVLADCGRSDEALAHYKEALKIKPDYAEAQYNLGVLLARQGQIDEALACFRTAVKIKPHYAEAQYDLGLLLAGRGRFGQALACYRKAVESRPDFVPALNNLAWLQATRPEARLRDATAALELARRAAALTRGSSPGVLDTLAAAYAEAGMFSQAQETVHKALSLARQQHNDGLVATLLARLRLYEAGKPYRQPLQPSAD